MLQAIERYMKQAIVDKVSSVSSSALVSSLVSEQVAAGFFRVLQFLWQKQSITVMSHKWNIQKAIYICVNFLP